MTSLFKPIAWEVRQGYRKQAQDMAGSTQGTQRAGVGAAVADPSGAGPLAFKDAYLCSGPCLEAATIRVPYRESRAHLLEAVICPV